MIGIGINGFGRIGKCCLLQLLNDTTCSVKCINSTALTINDIEDYLKYDSTHVKYDRNFKVEIVSSTCFKINHHVITLVADRNPKNIPWRSLGCDTVIEATGSFLTTNKCAQHDVDNVIITAPAKDDTPTYIYGVNHENYTGESVISASSCTSNCLAPILHLLSQEYGIKNSIFTTIHATTASQNTVDIANQKARTSRSIFNNIIPHSTGASSSVINVLPELRGKVFGTSVRVPVVNCSLLDLNVELDTITTNMAVGLNEICKTIQNNKYYGEVYDINHKKLVSMDFATTETPCILDVKSCIDAGDGKFKLMLWYDNEWSYSTQIIRLTRHIAEYKTKQDNKSSQYLPDTRILTKHFIENMDLRNKKVVCRFDYNVPMTPDKQIIDDFRIASTVKTINYILEQSPKYVVLVSHLGRPKGSDASKSLRALIPTIEKHLQREVIFLPHGVSEETIECLATQNAEFKSSTPIYLLENIRFHPEETNYDDNNDNIKNPITQLYGQLGNVFISDAFGCMHRKHMSIHAISKFRNCVYGYGYLVKKEIENIIHILNNDKRKLAIIGGNKIKDKMPFVDLIKSIPNTTVFIGGKIATEYQITPADTNVHVMTDGYGNTELAENELRYYIPNIKISSTAPHSTLNVYDIGEDSLNIVFKLIDENDVVFWNGALGVIENSTYVQGSLKLINYLKAQTNKTVIIGGGDTATLIDKTATAPTTNNTNHIYVSTGGGALLEFIENVSKLNGYLPGIDIFT